MSKKPYKPIVPSSGVNWKVVGEIVVKVGGIVIMIATIWRCVMGG